MRKLIISLVFWGTCLACPALAQGDDFLAHFSALKSESSVLLNWTTRAGNTCDGIDILRSTDNVAFIEVGHIGGVCGSPGEAQAFTFTDISPILNQTNYYKLILGSVGVSSVRAIEVVAISGSGYLIKPNPVIDEAKLYFENPNHENCTLSAFSISGAPAFTQATRDEYFQIEAAIHFPGLYFFRIQNPEGAIIAKGKVILSGR